eukprot:scaffold3008_cov59-Attheya_sp.AAC.1
MTYNDSSYQGYIGAIVDAADDDMNKLVLFRGSSKDLYGPTGASQECLEEFLPMVPFPFPNNHTLAT